MTPDAECRSCRMPIRWVVTQNGKRMPLDPVPDPEGNVWIEGMENGVPKVQVALTAADVPANVPIRYVSHFVSCPDRDSWRKP